MLLTVFYQHVTKGEAGVFDEKLRAEKSSLHPNTKKATMLILNFEWNIMQLNIR